MRPLELGLPLLFMEDPPTGTPVPWTEIRRRAQWAEEAGFDTVWIPDELLWEVDAWPGPRGFWECVAIAGAVAEATSQITVGTWVLSALHRNPALTAKIASTLDEISGGRFIFGFGAGHSGKQGKAYGYPESHVVDRYEEALHIVVPLLRGETVASDGTHHRAALADRPSGPQGAGIPIMLAGHGPRTIALAVAHGDMWSAYATKSSQPEAFAEMMQMVDRACEEAGRDPESIGRSIGVEYLPEETDPAEYGVTEPLTGPPAQVAETIQQFADMGVTSLEIMVMPPESRSFEALAAALAEFD